MTRGIRTHRLVRRNVVLHRDAAGQTQKMHTNTGKNATTPVKPETPFADALGAFAEDAGWTEFIAAVENEKQAQNQS